MHSLLLGAKLCLFYFFLFCSILARPPPFCFIPSHPTPLYSILFHPIPVSSVWEYWTPEPVTQSYALCSMKPDCCSPATTVCCFASVRVSNWHLLCSTAFVVNLGSQVPASIASILVLVLSSHLLCWATPQVPH